MLSTLPKPRRRGRVLAGLIGVAAATGILVVPAGAVPQDVSAAVTGSLTTFSATFDLADSSGVFAGSYDPDTGALTGGFVFQVSTISVTTPIPATVSLILLQPTEGTGQVDLVTNAVTYSGTLELDLLDVNAPSIGDGTVNPCMYTMPLNMTGTIDPVTGVLSMSQSTSPWTAVQLDGRCIWTAIGADISGVLDANVIGAPAFPNVLDVSFDVGDTTATPPTTTSTIASTTTTPTAPPAVASGGSPNFTG